LQTNSGFKGAREWALAAVTTPCAANPRATRVSALYFLSAFPKAVQNKAPDGGVKNIVFFGRRKPFS
jgi:hypothetical protein